MKTLLQKTASDAGTMPFGWSWKYLHWASDIATGHAHRTPRDHNGSGSVDANEH